MAADEIDELEEPTLLEEEEEASDNAMLFTSALVFTTFGLLLLAHFVAQKALADLFGKGLFS